MIQVFFFSGRHRFGLHNTSSSSVYFFQRSKSSKPCIRWMCLFHNEMCARVFMRVFMWVCMMEMLDQKWNIHKIVCNKQTRGCGSEKNFHTLPFGWNYIVGAKIYNNTMRVCDVSKWNAFVQRPPYGGLVVIKFAHNIILCLYVCTQIWETISETRGVHLYIITSWNTYAVRSRN